MGKFDLLVAAILPGYAAGKRLLDAGPIVAGAVNVPQTIRAGGSGNRPGSRPGALTGN